MKLQYELNIYILFFDNLFLQKKFLGISNVRNTTNFLNEICAPRDQINCQKCYGMKKKIERNDQYL